MTEALKKDFVVALKRLTNFYDSIKDYKPTEQVIKEKDFIDQDFTQEFKILDSSPADPILLNVHRA